MKQNNTAACTAGFPSIVLLRPTICLMADAMERTKARDAHQRGRIRNAEQPCEGDAVAAEEAECGYRRGGDTREDLGSVVC